MQPRRLLCLALVSLAMISLALLTACGSSSSTQTQPSTPVFTSVPVMAATQDVAYTYQLAATDPAGGAVTFALTSSPTGAALSGSTITWTPTAAESRVSNSFAVKATTTSGGTAAQSWMVTPGGTITVNWINNDWAANGPVHVPALPSAAANLSAMWTNPDGSITVQKSSATSPGVFSIPNVPGGYYWLQDGSQAFWTNSSTFDAGADVAGGPTPTLSYGLQTTQFDFNLSGLESVPETTPVDFVAAVSGVPQLGLFDFPDSTSLTGQSGFIGGDIDWSQINTGFLMQWVPATLGSLNNLVLGPSVTATNLSLTSGGTNAITETLQPSAQASINLSVPGSQWAPLLSGSNIALSPPTPFASALAISAQMYVTQGLASGTVPLSSPVGLGVGVIGVGVLLVPPLTLVGTADTLAIIPVGCSPMGFVLSTPNLAQPAITTDQNFGRLQYGDPFPGDWARTLSLCQESTVTIPVSGFSTPATFLLVDSATVAPSSTPLAPVVLPVQNPTIFGFSLFNATDSNTNIVPLSWSAPSGTAPFGYTVRVYVQTVEKVPPSTHRPEGLSPRPALQSACRRWRVGTLTCSPLRPTPTARRTCRQAHSVPRYRPGTRRSSPGRSPSIPGRKCLRFTAIAAWSPGFRKLNRTQRLTDGRDPELLV